MSWNKALVAWFLENQREMPWRSHPSAYRTWLSEIMLQQTQVDTVIPYFNRFLATFPTVEDLAAADLQQVLKMWEGLGYYSRARNLHKAAKEVVDKYHGKLPTSYEELQTLTGIGPYTGAAIASIAFNQPIPVVDGNVLRVFTRFWGIEEDIRLPQVRDSLFEKLKPAISECKPSDFNQAMMELGALLCSPKNPKCALCPISKDCVAFKNNLTESIPFKSKSKPVPHYHIGVGIVQKNGQVLIAKRKETQMLGGLWEFPGGKQKEGESLTETVERELFEETTLRVVVKEPLISVNHAYTHFKITLHAYFCDYLGGTPQAKTSDEIKWVSLSEIHTYPFPKANGRVLEKLQELS
jgi:A/G-specific adenine glycosylase